MGSVTSARIRGHVKLAAHVPGCELRLLSCTLEPCALTGLAGGSCAVPTAMNVASARIQLIPI
eukprot:6152834-Prymnesium_polylepis.1